MSPLAIDLFCGLGGWTEGLLAEGYCVVGFDTVRHAYGEAQYPAQLVLQDVLTLHGAQFKDAALIVASPPCQAYSYRAMPWTRAKALPPPDNSLFEACFRIQREACEAAGQHIPLVVENVCGAQKWVGRARWHFGSYYLWGDVPALMPIRRRGSRVQATAASSGVASTINTPSSATAHPLTNGPLTPTSPEAQPEGVKQAGIAGLRHNGLGDRWFQDGAASLWSNSHARKAASAHIAKIPLALSRWIAKCYYPHVEFSNEENRCSEGGDVWEVVGSYGSRSRDRVASEI